MQEGTYMQVWKYGNMQVCKYASMHIYASMQECNMQVLKYMQVSKYAQICKYASMQAISYIQWFSENSLPYSNLLYPTY